MSLDRRDFLKGAGAVAATACVAKPEPVEPGSIDHIVLVMMENRSFDHALGSLTLLEGRDDVDGLTAAMSNPAPDGGTIHPDLLTEYCLADPPHGWDSSRVQRSGGTNQGFAQAYYDRHGDRVDPAWVLGYQDRAAQPISYALSDAYVTCDRWFCSLLTSTWPNRLYSHGAQNEGMTGNDLPNGLFYTMRTIWDQLDEAGVEWSYYYADAPFIAVLGVGFNHPRVRPIAEFFSDCTNGTLPAVCMVDPAFLFNDDHPPHHPMLGQIFLGSVHNALATSPLWERCLLSLTYDEHGGFFDHVPPPTAADDRAAEGFDQLGFRVPSLVMGPWVQAGLVHHEVLDHTSPLATIQRRHGLGHLTSRDAAANDLYAVLDTAAMEAHNALMPAELPVIALSEEEILGQCRARRGSQPELEAVLDAIGDPRWSQADLGAVYRDLLEQAERLGVCTLS